MLNLAIGSLSTCFSSSPEKKITSTHSYTFPTLLRIRVYSAISIVWVEFGFFPIEVDHYNHDDNDVPANTTRILYQYHRHYYHHHHHGWTCAEATFLTYLTIDKMIKKHEKRKPPKWRINVYPMFSSTKGDTKGKKGLALETCTIN